MYEVQFENRASRSLLFFFGKVILWWKWKLRNNRGVLEDFNRKWERKRRKRKERKEKRKKEKKEKEKQKKRKKNKIFFPIEKNHKNIWKWKLRSNGGVVGKFKRK